MRFHRPMRDAKGTKRVGLTLALPRLGAILRASYRVRLYSQIQNI